MRTRTRRRIRTSPSDHPPSPGQPRHSRLGVGTGRFHSRQFCTDTPRPAGARRQGWLDGTRMPARHAPFGVRVGARKARSGAGATADTWHLQIASLWHLEIVCTWHLQIASSGHFQIASSGHWQIASSGHFPIPSSGHLEIVSSEHFQIASVWHLEIPSLWHFQIAFAWHFQIAST
jgi:hypothetical protein